MDIFDYDNVLLLPRKCRVTSRSECDTRVTFGPRAFRIPVVPANMKTVVDERLCTWLAEHDYFYVMHRFDLDTVAFVRDMRGKGLYASISVGIKAADRAVVDALAAERLMPEYITIDVAHGHSDGVRDMIAHIKDRLPGSFVIAGNVLENRGGVVAAARARGRAHRIRCKVRFPANTAWRHWLR